MTLALQAYASNGEADEEEAKPRGPTDFVARWVRMVGSQGVASNEDLDLIQDKQEAPAPIPFVSNQQADDWIPPPKTTLYEDTPDEAAVLVRRLSRVRSPTRKIWHCGMPVQFVSQPFPIHTSNSVFYPACVCSSIKQDKQADDASQSSGSGDGKDDSSEADAKSMSLAATSADGPEEMLADARRGRAIRKLVHLLLGPALATPVQRFLWHSVGVLGVLLLAHVGDPLCFLFHLMSRLENFHLFSSASMCN